MSREEKKLRWRYDHLVEKKYGMGLTPEEKKELKTLNKLLDAYDAEYYGPILDKLQKAYNKLKKEKNV